ncbi:MAG: hypothetical protein ACHQEB_06015 [Chitinophagales bacterium]
MPSDFQHLFIRLREILQKKSGSLTIRPDNPDHYGLEGKTGPATVKVWGGKMKSPLIPVAWVQIGKAYVSFHLMGIYMNTALQKNISKELKAHMQGKSCFNFKKIDETLFRELDQLTEQSIVFLKKYGYIL